MISVLDIDKIFRFVASFVYRAIIIILSAYVFTTRSNENYFIYEYYIYAIVTYFIVQTLLLTKFRKYPLLRLSIDYCLIAFVLYGKGVDDFLLASLLFIPIFNAPNHSGEKRSYILYVVAFSVALYVGSVSNIYLFALVFLFLWIIGYFEQIRTRLNRINESLCQIVDSTYYNNLDLGKTHKIYHNLIKRIDSSQYSDRIQINNIYCLTEKNGRLIIVNTTKYSYEIDIEKKIIEKLKDGNRNILFNVLVNIDGEKTKNNYLMLIDGKEKKYFFVVSFKKNSYPWLTILFARYILTVVFSRIVLVLELEEQLKIMKKSYFENFSENFEYFEKAKDTMHFVNNKFSPLKGLIQGFTEWDKETDAVKKDKVFEILKKLRNRADQSLGEIERRASRMLSRANEIQFKELERYSLGRLFSNIRRIWSDYFGNEPFENKWPLDLLQNEVSLSDDGIYLVLTNIIDNMDKYNNGFLCVLFGVEEANYTVTFKNDFKKDVSEVKTIVEEFMAEESAEIDNRRSHGLTTIKKIMRQMPIDYSVFVENDLYCFKITIRGENGTSNN